MPLQYLNSSLCSPGYCATGVLAGNPPHSDQVTEGQASAGTFTRLWAGAGSAEGAPPRGDPVAVSGDRGQSEEGAETTPAPRPLPLACLAPKPTVVQSHLEARGQRDC